MKIKFFISAALMVAACCALGQGADYLYFNHFTSENGLPSNQVRAMAIDRQGVLWLGASEGLIRFDGQYGRLYRPGKLLNPTEEFTVKALIEARDGAFWLATQGAGVFRFDPEREVFKGFRSKPADPFSLSHPESLCLLEDRKGRIWVGTETGLSIYFPALDVWISYGEADGLGPGPFSGVLSLKEDLNGGIWVGSWNGGLSVCDPQPLDEYRPGKPLPACTFHPIPFFSQHQIRVWSLMLDPKGRLWVGTVGKGIFVSEKPLSYEAVQAPESTLWLGLATRRPANLSEEFILDIKQDSRGQIWVGTYSGLYISGPVPGEATPESLAGWLTSPWRHIQKNTVQEAGLVSNNVYCITFGPAGKTWLGTAGGVSQINHQAAIFHTHPFDTGMPAQVSAIKAAGDTGLWVAAPGGIWQYDFARQESRAAVAFTRYIFDFLPQGKDRLWLAAPGGVWQATAGSKLLLQLPADGHAAKAEFKRIVEGPNGKIWVASSLGMYLFDPNVPAPVLKKVLFPQIKDPEVLDLYFQGDILWAATENHGLLQATIANDQVQDLISRFPKPDDPRSLNNNHLTRLAKTDSGMWIGSPAGLWHFHLEKERFQHYAPGLKSPSKSVNSLQVDQEGMIWLWFNGAMGVFNPSTHQFRFFRRKHGLNAFEIEPNAALLTPAGELYFGGLNGIQHLDRAKLAPYSTAPHVQLSEIRIFNEPLFANQPDTLLGKPVLERAAWLTSSLKLHREHRMVGFRISVIGIADPSDAHVSYRLLGLNPRWTHLEDQREIVFQGLPPGEYQLQVRASSGYSTTWGPALTLSIKIDPPFWASGWFISLCIALLAASAYGWFTLQKKIAFRRAETLEKEIQERTTDLAQAHAREQEARAEAEQAARSKSDFLAVMSHEIRTPLHAVISMANQLNEDAPRPDQLEAIQTLKISGDHLLTLINNVLDFSKIESQKLQLERIPFDLQALGERITRLIAVKAALKQVEVRYFFDPALPPWRLGDPARIAQILTNLLGNAEKFTETGFVSLACIKTDNHTVRVKVSDTGPGIPTDKQSAIFEAFSQQGTETARKYGGTGLGLTITRRLLQLMGTDIRVESAPGSGATFIFDLPVPESLPPQKRTLNPSETEPSFSLNNALILIAEDNKVNQKIVKRYLEKWGARSLFAADGQEALDLAAAHPDIALVLMDNHMPIMDGLEATIELRKRGFLAPIIGLSAAALEEEVHKMRAAGLDDFVAKPFDPSQLLEKIMAYLNPVNPQPAHPDTPSR